jgi:chromosome partitioning protein
MTRVIAIANHAGGVAKTTTTLNLGHALAEGQGPQRRVLLVDFDPQGNLTEGLGFCFQSAEVGPNAVVN